MMANFDLQEDLQGHGNLETYDIHNERDISSMQPREVDQLLSDAVHDISVSYEAIQNPYTFDAYRSFLKYVDCLSESQVSKLLDSVVSGFQAQRDAAIADTNSDYSDTFETHKLGVEKYAFLLNWFISASDRIKPSGEGGNGSVVTPTSKGRKGKGGKNAPTNRKESEWEDQIPHILQLISQMLENLKIVKVWKTTPERNALIRCLTGPAYRVAEKESYMKSADIRSRVYKVICHAVKLHGHRFDAQASIIQCLQYFEHLAEPMAELVSQLATEYNHPQLGDGLLSDIAEKSFSSQDSKGPRVFSKFLIKYAEEAPEVVFNKRDLLMVHLDSESYPMRMAIVEILGRLISYLDNDTDLDPKIASADIDGLLSKLLSRQLDISSYVRVKVFNTLHRLCNITPERRPVLAVTEAALDALNDKVASVRKSAIALLSRLIEEHPFWQVFHGQKEDVKLDLSLWEKSYEHLKQKREAIELEVQRLMAGSDGQDDDDEGGRSDSEQARRPNKSSGDADADAMDVDDDEQEDPGKAPSSNTGNSAGYDREAALGLFASDRFKALVFSAKLCGEAVAFIKKIDMKMGAIALLLGSTHKAEVLESIEFFRIAQYYGLDGAKIGIKKMIHLIWSKDNNSTSEDGLELKGIRSKLLDAYREMYFTPLAENITARKQVERIANNMIRLTKNASLAELTSLEEMMRIMMEDDQIHDDIVSELWRLYRDRNTDKYNRRGAIIILGMLALARREIVTNKVDALIRIGLGPLGKADLILAKYTCVALQRMNGSAKKVKGSLLDKNVRYDMNNIIFRNLQDAIEYPCHSIDWFGMTEQAINTIYALGDHPDILCNKLIKNLTRRAFARNTNAASQSQRSRAEDAMEEDAPGPSQTSPNGFASTQPQSQAGATHSGDVGDAFELSQMIFVVGHVAIKHLVYLELVERDWKRQKNEHEAVEKASGPSQKDGDDLEAVVGNAEDEIGDRIAAVRETELLYGPDSLLAVYGDMVAEIVGRGRFVKYQTLHTAAILTLSKFLCISSRYCDQYHHLLFKKLKLSEDPTICSNIVIALGDVAVSFSTIIDENSNELYRGLSNRSLIVRKNTLMVLTHLILNGMIKVKGQLGEMAKCLEDDDLRISDLAKLFFTELSTKDNAIYNNLPDVISHLSVGDNALGEEAFQSTMKYIFSFIEKERQAENIVEKLCQRFHLSEDPRQWRDIAFCLSLLPFKSERSVKKLIEGLQFYRDKLHEETVYSRFQEILVKARANKSANKPDTQLNEFENILKEHKLQGEEDQELEKRAAGKKAKKRSRKSSKRKVKPVKHEQEEDGEND